MRIFEEEQRRAGTLVTRELFITWKKSFDTELAAAHTKQKNAELVLTTRRLTGKQLFEQDASLATSDALFMEGDEGVEDDESSDETGEKDDIDWTLYEDEDYEEESDEE